MTNEVKPDAPKETKPGDIDAALQPELEKLRAMQGSTKPKAEAILNDAVARLMAIGYTLDGAVVTLRDEATGFIKAIEGRPYMRPLNLAEWQEVGRAKLRHDLSGGA